MIAKAVPLASLSAKQIAAVQQRLLDWYGVHQRDLPWRKTHDPYAILVSEIMLQQTQVDRVIPKYLDFLSRFPSLHSLASSPTAEVIRAWVPLGYNLRAVRLQRIAQQVVAEHGGHLPQKSDALRKLEGIGAYTAAAIACFAFGLDVPVLDTNVRRVLTRVFLGLTQPQQRQIEALAASVLPKGRASQWHQGLMDLGATLCTAARPRCLLCPLHSGCIAAPLLQNGQHQVADPKAQYRAKAQPFRGSTRYFRGRIIDFLRQLPPGEHIDLRTVGQRIKEDFSDEDLPWLEGLTHALEHDGLLRRSPQSGAPETATVIVSLP